MSRQRHLGNLSKEEWEAFVGDFIGLLDKHRVHGSLYGYDLYTVLNDSRALAVLSAKACVTEEDARYAHQITKDRLDTATEECLRVIQRAIDDSDPDITGMDAGERSIRLVH